MLVVEQQPTGIDHGSPRLTVSHLNAPDAPVDLRLAGKAHHPAAGLEVLVRPEPATATADADAIVDPAPPEVVAWPKSS